MPRLPRLRAARTPAAGGQSLTSLHVSYRWESTRTLAVHMHSHSRFTTAGNKRWIAIAWPSIVFMTFLILVILTAMASVGCWRASSDKSGASRLPSTARQVAAPRQVLGAGSCSGSGCHSSSVEGHPAWQSSYTVWAKDDRHARAYRVLF